MAGATFELEGLLATVRSWINRSWIKWWHIAIPEHRNPGDYHEQFSHLGTDNIFDITRIHPQARRKALPIAACGGTPTLGILAAVYTTPIHGATINSHPASQPQPVRFWVLECPGWSRAIAFGRAHFKVLVLLCVKPTLLTTSSSQIRKMAPILIGEQSSPPGRLAGKARFRERRR